MYTLALILIPYSFGQLLYYNMTFFAGGQYIVKTIAPLLLIEILSGFKRDGHERAGFIPLLIFLFFLGFICSISSEGYVFLLGFFPVMLCYAWLVLLNKRSVREFFADRGMWICVAVTAISFIGIIIRSISSYLPL